MGLPLALDSIVGCKWTVSSNVQLEFFWNAIVKETMLNSIVVYQKFSLEIPGLNVVPHGWAFLKALCICKIYC